MGSEQPEPHSKYMGRYFVACYNDPSKRTQYHNPAKLELAAKETLSPESYDYVAGGAGNEETIANNAAAFQAWQIVPRMLVGVDIADFDFSTTLFGRRFPSPFVVCPIGVQGQLHAEADCATARAAAKLQIPFTLSTAASKPMEEVSATAGFAAGTAEGWYQLYQPVDDDITRSLLARAKTQGYKVLVVTVDTWYPGWRPRDLNGGFKPLVRASGTATLFSDPVFVAKYCGGTSPLRSGVSRAEIDAAAGQFARQLVAAGKSRGWRDIERLREWWGTENRMVLKGIQSVPDARKALDVGVDGIWVSNHGGRQVEGAIGSLRALERIAGAMRDAKTRKGMKPTIIFDSGVRGGADAMKALCLGADAVGIGRPFAYALSLGGEDGVAAVLKSFLCDLEINAALSGARSVAELNQDFVERRT